MATIDEAAIRRAGKGSVEIIRHGDFIAILSADETVVDAAASVASGHVTWDGIDPINPSREEDAGCYGSPRSINLWARRNDNEPLQADYEATFSTNARRPCLDRAILWARALS